MRDGSAASGATALETLKLLRGGVRTDFTDDRDQRKNKMTTMVS
jgi:hypothetical protein